MNIGTILILFSLIISFITLISSLVSSVENKRWWRNAKVTSERLFYLSGIFIFIAVVLLFIAFLTDSFNFNYVYNYSSRDLSLVYKITAFWAGQEGTFLLWVFLLYVFGFFIIRSKDENEGILLAVISITQIFILMILLVHSPFKYIWDAHSGHFDPGVIPPDGSGLNPLLQDPWMVIHPPVLFLGYASSTIPFAYAIVGLIKNEYNTWIHKAYRWVLFCTTTLGIGIFLGGYWAYIVLGWGGYWGWDPVENSSLIPWIFLVALVHGLLLQKRKNVLIKTNIFLALISHILVFYSTFLTRSGILSDFSVHSFSDLGLSGYLIFSIIFFILISIVLFIKRYRDIESNTLSDKILKSDNIISYGIITLSFYSIFILVGTSMPIISKIFLKNPTSVTTKYYNNLSIPLGILILVLIGLATIYQFKNKINKRNIIKIIALSFILGILFNLFHTKNVFAYVFTIIALVIIMQSIIDIFTYKTGSVIASRLSHMGIALLVIGVVSSNLHSFSIKKKLVQNVEEKIDSIKLTFMDITKSMKSNLIFKLTQGSVEKDIQTEYYINKKTNSLYREPYISYGLIRDVYISPVEYKSASENSGKIFLSKGEEREVDGLKIKFEGFAIDKDHMRTKTPKLFANVNINFKGKNYLLSPGLRMDGRNIRKKIDAKIPLTKRTLSLVNFDVRSKKVLLHLSPQKDSPLPSASVIVEVSFKRLIWFVWLGTVIVSIGGFWAYRKSFI